ncbi:MAG: bifunctional [glutamate--ammonia ligase]-adenylyl-L-tyrosine phosphorylase/[glutamate--ammonia-ligase] adenylyltransferase [Immundisolibacter sp.]|uniref:bifunctional [glutamate--ammonia ligase]-adenylyl-L-tyrosine phosphorylase/[glutamate--ammonia-ligase] adenylyltransferase n=1 Tax=Immundisolibacter sp. TaxID=1934948 RepID=UPI003EE31DC5
MTDHPAQSALALAPLPVSAREAVADALHGLLEYPALAELSTRGRWLTVAPRVLAASEFVTELCQARPQLLAELLDTDRLESAANGAAVYASVQAGLAQVADEAELRLRLRLLRSREMLRIAWRDLAGWADLDETLAALSALADACIHSALDWLYRWQLEQLGPPQDSRGQAVGLVVLGMGKLGGEELNFSSDVDLIFGFEHAGVCQGPGEISNEEFFLRLARRLVSVLDEVDASGRVFRVDVRLRPFGNSGPLAVSFDAAEDYYQNHGRDWERYALIKARPVAGDLAAGERLLQRLRPFVFRRYLDFGAIDALRAMKALIVEQVRRESLHQNIKLGAGGIREIEFIGQMHQLIRGGREPDLRCRGIRQVLQLLGARGQLPATTVDELHAAYDFLRRLENRLQMQQDRQTHEIPADPVARSRLALAMDYPDWDGCAAALGAWRRCVHDHFASLLGEARGLPPAQRLWPDGLDRLQAIAELTDLGYADPEQALAHLKALRDGRACRIASAAARQRLDTVLPDLLRAAVTTNQPELTLGRLCTLLEAVATRSVYLAMLIEHPLAREHLARLMGASAWIADWITSHPVVLDELLDARTLYAPQTGADVERELDQALSTVATDDLETAMNALREHRHAAALHVAAAEIGALLDSHEPTQALTELAEVLLRRALLLAQTHMSQRHGRPRDGAEPSREAQLLVIAYGRLGSAELGYESDLDLVFLHDALGGHTDGPAQLANETYFARVVQRLTHILTTLTPAGRLYEIDFRLRPSGNAGPLVTTLSGFETYQREEAWTWEHQALVRARPVAGDVTLGAAFETTRQHVLCQAREPDQLRRDIATMRERIREEKGQPAQGFDLKLSPGGRVDIEFIAQYLVLAHAHTHPQITAPRGTTAILNLAGKLGLLAPDAGAALGEAFVSLCAIERQQTLHGLGSVVELPTVAHAAQQVREAWLNLFGGQTKPD